MVTYQKMDHVVPSIRLTQIDPSFASWQPIRFGIIVPIVPLVDCPSTLGRRISRWGIRDGQGDSIGSRFIDDLVDPIETGWNDPCLIGKHRMGALGLFADRGDPVLLVGQFLDRFEIGFLFDGLIQSR